MYTITIMYGRQLTDLRTRVYYEDGSYNMYMDSFINDYNEGNSIGYLLGVKTTVVDGVAVSSVLYEGKREYPPIRELNIKRENATCS